MNNSDFLNMYKSMYMLTTISTEELNYSFNDEVEFFDFLKGVYNIFSNNYGFFFISDIFYVKLFDLVNNKLENVELDDFSLLYISYIEELGSKVMEIDEDLKIESLSYFLMANEEVREVEIDSRVDLAKYVGYDYIALDILNDNSENIKFDFDLFLSSTSYMLEATPSVYTKDMVDNCLFILETYKDEVFLSKKYRDKVGYLKGMLLSMDVDSNKNNVISFKKFKNKE